MKVTTPIRVRYAETDMMGVVYHANYLLYFEDARTDFLVKAGCPYDSIEDAGYMCPVLSLDLHYGEPLRYGEEAFVVTSVVSNRPTKTVYYQELYREGATPGADKPLVWGHVTACTVERETFRPVSIKRVLPDLYAAYERIVEEEA